MPVDPLAQVIEGATEIDCGDPSCYGIHNLGPLPGESRADHIARLRARFVGDPEVVGVPAGRMAETAHTVTCGACGRFRRRGHECVYCSRIVTVGRPV